MPVNAVLFSEMTPAPAWEAEFNAWYDDEHIPLRVACPGFVGAQRYRADGRPGYLAVYDMDSPEALQTPEYTAVKTQPTDLTARMLRDVTGFTRYIGVLSGWHIQPGLGEEQMLTAPVLFSVMFSVPPDRSAELDDWYVQEHVPMLMRAPAWLGVRRYRITLADPGPYTHLIIHHLRDTEVLNGPERAAARATEWRARLAKEAWFSGRYDLFHRHGRRFQGSRA
jgi:hypothetical protein